MTLIKVLLWKIYSIKSAIPLVIDLKERQKLIIIIILLTLV
jgi:hypothetical protein